MKNQFCYETRKCSTSPQTGVFVFLRWNVFGMKNLAQHLTGKKSTKSKNLLLTSSTESICRKTRHWIQTSWFLLVCQLLNHPTLEHLSCKCSYCKGFWERAVRNNNSNSGFSHWLLYKYRLWCDLHTAGSHWTYKAWDEWMSWGVTLYTSLAAYLTLLSCKQVFTPL